MPFGSRHSLLGPSCARREISLPHGQPTRRACVWNPTGLSRSAPDRCDRVGCPLYPGGGGALPPDQIRPGGTRRLTATGPYLPLEHPIGESAGDEASTRVHAIHPSGLPQPVAIGWNDGPWALPRASHPTVTRDARRGGDGPSHWTGRYVCGISRPPSTRVTACVRLRVARSAPARSATRCAPHRSRRRRRQPGPRGSRRTVRLSTYVR